MLNIIYDMDGGIAVPDNKVKDYSETLVLTHAASSESVEVRIGCLNIIRSIAYAMKHNNIPHTNATISYAHNPEAKIWYDSDYNLDGYHDFCKHDIQVLMDMF